MGEKHLCVMVCDRCGAKQELREDERRALKGWDVARLVRTGARDNPYSGLQEEYQYADEKTLCPHCMAQKIEMWREYNGKLIAWFEEGAKMDLEEDDHAR